MNIPSYRRQLIPSRKWGHYVSTTAQMTAIVDPVRGMTCFVSDDGDLYVYSGTAWVLLPAVGVAPSGISPAQITADTNDWSPTGFASAKIIRIDSDNGFRAITSMAAGSSWEEKTLINVGSSPVYFPSNHPSGVAANRFIVPQDFILDKYRSATFIYDPVSQKWRPKTPQPDVSQHQRYEWFPGYNTSTYWDLLETVNTGTASFTTQSSTSSSPSYAIMAAGNSGFQGCLLPKGIRAFGYFGDQHLYAETMVRCYDTSDASQKNTLQLQLTATTYTTTDEPNNTVGLRSSYDIASGNWELFTKDNSGSESTADTGVARGTGIQKIRIEINKSNTEARAYIDDVLVAIVNSNMPSGVAGARFFIKKNVGTTAHYARINYLKGGAYGTEGTD